MKALHRLRADAGAPLNVTSLLPVLASPKEDRNPTFTSRFPARGPVIWLYGGGPPVKDNRNGATRGPSRRDVAIYNVVTKGHVMKKVSTAQSIPDPPPVPLSEAGRE